MVEFWTDPKTGEAYGAFHIPLRVRKSVCPWGGKRWVKYLKEHEPRPTFRNGKTWSWTPSGDWVMGSPDWVVESFDWFLPKDPDGLPPDWKVFQRFRTQADARDFCVRYRQREKELKEIDNARQGWKVEVK